MRLLEIRCLLIVLFLVLPIGCGEDVGTPANNRTAAELVLKQGGSVRVEGVTYAIDKVGKLPAGDIVLKEINLAEKTCTDEDLKMFTDLKALEKLNLYGTGVTNQGLDLLLPLAALKELELSYTLITDEGLRKLKDIKPLEKLTLYGTKVTDDGVKSFQLLHPKVKILR
jgi:Leucine Rich repeat